MTKDSANLHAPMSVSPRLIAAVGVVLAVILLAVAFWPFGGSDSDADSDAAREGNSAPVIAAPPEIAGPAAAEAIKGALREDQYISMDAARHPKEMLAFAGVGPGMTVMEWRGALGYYTELLSSAVGKRGKVYVSGIVNQAIMGRLKNVQVVAEDGHDVPTDSVDLVFTHLNYHDLVVQKVDRVALLGSAIRVLKVGGALVVIDHVAAPGSGTRDTVALHRIDEAFVRDEIARLGFTFQRSSDVLRRPNDNHQVFVMDERIRGRTDRFALRFLRPARISIPAVTADERIEAPIDPAASANGAGDEDTGDWSDPTATEPYPN